MDKPSQFTEYVILVALVIVVTAATLTLLGDGLTALLTSIAETFQDIPY